MDREFTSRIERLFTECGVTEYRYDHGGKHPLLIARHHGAFVRYAIPSTGSDRRGVANCLAFLRRALDLHPRAEKRQAQPRRARCAVKQSRAPLNFRSGPEAASSKPSWQECLAAHFQAGPGDALGC